MEWIRSAVPEKSSGNRANSTAYGDGGGGGGGGGDGGLGNMTNT